MRNIADELPLPSVHGVEHGFAHVDGLRIHYAHAGSGDPLVLVHGWPQHWFAWRAVIGPLSTRYQVICPDFRGLGWSHGSASDHSLRRLGDDIVGLLDALGIDRARLVGHDLGGGAGYQACLDHPERIERFVALTTIPPWLTLKASPMLYLRPWHIYLLALPIGARLAPHQHIHPKPSAALATPRPVQHRRTRHVRARLRHGISSQRDAPLLPRTGLA